jgi:hypothetical protein
MQRDPNVKVVGDPVVFEQRTIYYVRVESDLLIEGCRQVQDVWLDDGGWVRFRTECDT